MAKEDYENSVPLGTDSEFESEKEEILEEMQDYGNFDMEEESDIKVQDAFGEYLKEIGNIPLLTQEEETELFKHRDDPEAKRKIIEANLRLVVYVARRYRTQTIPIEDLVGEGNTGLMIAVDRFNPDMGTKFSTYAFYWIRQAITRGITAKEGVIRVPDHIQEDFYKIKRAMCTLEQVCGRTPEPSEIAEETGLTEKRVKFVLDAKPIMVSLSTPVGEEGDGSELIDFLPSEAELTPEKVVEKEALKSIIDYAIKYILDDREAYIIQERFGLNDTGIPLTLEEVGAKMGITRERVRQIEGKALLKLRSPKNRKMFSGYFIERPILRETSLLPGMTRNYVHKRKNSNKEAADQAFKEKMQVELLKAAQRELEEKEHRSKSNPDVNTEKTEGKRQTTEKQKPKTIANKKSTVTKKPTNPTKSKKTTRAKSTNKQKKTKPMNKKQDTDNSDAKKKAKPKLRKGQQMTIEHIFV